MAINPVAGQGPSVPEIEEQVVPKAGEPEIQPEKTDDQGPGLLGRFWQRLNKGVENARVGSAQYEILMQAMTGNALEQAFKAKLLESPHSGIEVWGIPIEILNHPLNPDTRVIVFPRSRPDGGVDVCAVMISTDDLDKYFYKRSIGLQASLQWLQNLLFTDRVSKFKNSVCCFAATGEMGLFDTESFATKGFGHGFRFVKKESLGAKMLRFVGGYEPVYSEPVPVPEFAKINTDLFANDNVSPTESEVIEIVTLKYQASKLPEGITIHHFPTVPLEGYKHPIIGIVFSLSTPEGPVAAMIAMTQAEARAFSSAAGAKRYDDPAYKKFVDRVMLGPVARVNRGRWIVPFEDKFLLFETRKTRPGYFSWNTVNQAVYDRAPTVNVAEALAAMASNPPSKVQGDDSGPRRQTDLEAWFNAFDKKAAMGWFDDKKCVVLRLVHSQVFELLITRHGSGSNARLGVLVIPSKLGVRLLQGKLNSQERRDLRDSFRRSDSFVPFENGAAMVTVPLTGDQYRISHDPSKNEIWGELRTLGAKNAVGSFTQNQSWKTLGDLLSLDTNSSAYLPSPTGTKALYLARPTNPFEGAIVIVDQTRQLTIIESRAIDEFVLGKYLLGFPDAKAELQLELAKAMQNRPRQFFLPEEKWPVLNTAKFQTIYTSGQPPTDFAYSFDKDRIVCALTYLGKTSQTDLLPFDTAMIAAMPGAYRPPAYQAAPHGVASGSVATPKKMLPAGSNAPVDSSGKDKPVTPPEVLALFDRMVAQNNPQTVFRLRGDPRPYAVFVMEGEHFIVFQEGHSGKSTNRFLMAAFFVNVNMSVGNMQAEVTALLGKSRRTAGVLGRKKVKKYFDKQSNPFVPGQDFIAYNDGEGGSKMPNLQMEVRGDALVIKPPEDSLILPRHLWLEAQQASQPPAAPAAEEGVLDVNAGLDPSPEIETLPPAIVPEEEPAPIAIEPAAEVVPPIGPIEEERALPVFEPEVGRTPPLPEGDAHPSPLPALDVLSAPAKPRPTEEPVVTQIWNGDVERTDPFTLFLLREYNEKGDQLSQKLRLTWRDPGAKTTDPKELVTEVAAEASEVSFDVPLFGQITYFLDLDRPDGHLAAREGLPVQLAIEDQNTKQPYLAVSVGKGWEDAFVLERVLQDGQPHFFIDPAEAAILRDVMTLAGEVWPHTTDPNFRTEVLTDPAGGIQFQLTPYVSGEVGKQDIPINKATKTAIEQAQKPADMETLPASGEPAIGDVAINVPLDVLFEFGQGASFVTGPETLKKIKQAFYTLQHADGTTTRLSRFVEGQEDYYEIWNQETGVIFVLPVVWRGATRPKAPFEADPARSVFWYRAGESPGNARVITDPRLRFVKNGLGFKLDFLDAGYGLDQVKAFSIQSVASSQSPLFMGGVNWLSAPNEENSDRQAERLVVRAEIDQCAANGLGDDIDKYVPSGVFYRPRVSVAADSQRVRLKYFAAGGNRADSDPEWLELSNMVWNQQDGDRLQIKGFVNGVLGSGTGAGKVEHEQLRFLVATAPGEDASVNVLREVKGDGSLGRSFLWRGRSEEVISESALPDNVDVRDLPDLIEQHQLPVMASESEQQESSGNTGFRARGRRMTHKPSLKLDCGLKPLPFGLRQHTAYGPGDVRYCEATDHDWILNSLTALKDKTFLPDEESSFGLTVSGRDQEVFRFASPVGILELPMVWHKGRYEVDHWPDPVYGVRGARLLLRDPTHKGKLVQVPVVFHARRGLGTSKLEMILCLGSVQIADFDFEFSSVRNTLSRLPIRGLRIVAREGAQTGPGNPEEDKQAARREQRQARADAHTLLEEWTRELGLDEKGSFDRMPVEGKIGFDDGVTFSLGQTHDAHGEVAVTGISSDAAGNFVDGQDDQGRSVRIDIFRSERVGGLIYAKHGDEIRVLTADWKETGGTEPDRYEWVVFRRSRQLNGFFEAVSAQRFPMVNRDNSSYSFEGLSSALVDKKSEDENQLIVSVKASLGRFDGASEKSVMTEKSGKPRLEFELSVNKQTGEVCVLGPGTMSPDGSVTKSRDVALKIVALPEGVRVFAEEETAGFAWLEMSFGLDPETNLWNMNVTQGRHCFYRYPYDIGPSEAGFLGALWEASPADVETWAGLLEEPPLAGLREYLRGSPLTAQTMPEVFSTCEEHGFKATDPHFARDFTSLARGAWVGKDFFAERSRQELTQTRESRPLPSRETALGREFVRQARARTPNPAMPLPGTPATLGATPSFLSATLFSMPRMR